VIKGNYLVLGR